MNDDEEAISKVGQQRWEKFKQLQEKRQQLSSGTLNHKKRKISTPKEKKIFKKATEENKKSVSNTPLSVFLNEVDNDLRFQQNNNKVGNVIIWN